MRKFVLLTTLCMAGVMAMGQTVTTYAGKVNGDPVNNYESTSNVDVDDTYFAYPEGMCFDPSGRLFVSERNKLRMINGGKVWIRCGHLSGPTFSEGYKNATSTSAKFREPSGMVADADGNIYICDAGNHAIRKVTKYVNSSNPQAASTFAGSAPISDYGASGSANGTGTAARFNQPRGITIDASGNFYVTDYLNFTIRKITSAGVVTTLAGSAGVEGTTDHNSNGANARFGGPWGIAMYDDNNVVVTDPWNTNIRLVNINTGATSTLAGPTSGSDARHVDGTLTQARFKAPKGVVVVAGIIYVADQNIIRAIDVTNNSVTTFAGDKTAYSTNDGTGTNATFTEISDLTTDGKANLYASENSGVVSSHIIRKISIDNLAPDCDFTATKTNLIVDENTTLNDISGGAAVSSRTWTITPNDYTIKSGNLNSANLQIAFNSTGFYSVTLSITNEYGTDSKSVQDFFNVSTTGSITAFNANDLIKLYPNPAMDVVQIDAAAPFGKGQTHMQLLDIHGALLYDGEMKTSLDVSELSNGVYYITLVSDEMRAVKRLVVQK